jgi:hypothetical protein
VSRQRKSLYNPVRRGKMNTVMDEFWSIMCVPIGVTLCFGPALIAWVIAERRDARKK